MRSSIAIYLLGAACLAVIALVLYTLGLSGLALWNTAPVAVVFMVGACASRHSTVPGRAFAVAFASVVLAAVAWGHLSWVLSPPTGRGSSTAVIAFVFWPIYATVAGVMVALVPWIIARIMRRQNI